MQPISGYDNNIIFIYFLLHVEFISQVRHDKYVSIITAIYKYMVVHSYLYTIRGEH